MTFFASIVPCYENGIESIAGGVYLATIGIMSIFFLARDINRRAIRRHIFGIHYKNEENEVDRLIRERTPYKRKIIWHNVIYFSLRYGSAVFGFLCSNFLGKALFWTDVWGWLIWAVAVFTLPLASHRMYSHKAFKASRPYEVIMMLLNTILYQNSIIHWARDHRTHHKFVDTDADPHNAKRGLFFSQIGWLMVERHPEVLRQGRKIDISDLTANPVLRIQRKYSALITPLSAVVLFTIPQICWGESFWVSWFRVVDYPWAIIFTMVGLINSWSHYNGDRTYNDKITPSDGGWFRNVMTIGDGYHNFHHAFPQDYRSCEKLYLTSFSGHILKWFGHFGIVWDLKVTSPELIEKSKKYSAEISELGY